MALSGLRLWPNSAPARGGGELEDRELKRLY